MEYKKDDFLISTDKSKLDVDLVHRFLSTESYWAKNIPRTTVEKSIEHALCFGIYHGSVQVGYAKIISDFATIAYLGDVFVVESYRGRGLSKWLMECIIDHPQLQGLRRWILATLDAHTLYQKYGFTPLSKPERYLERFNPEVYG